MRAYADCVVTVGVLEAGLKSRPASQATSELLTSRTSNLRPPKLQSPRSQCPEHKIRYSGEVSAAFKPAAPIVYLGLGSRIRRHGVSAASGSAYGMSSRELSSFYAWATLLCLCMDYRNWLDI